METLFLILFAASVGAVMGSFGATAALRLACGESAITGRSRCDGCARALSWTQTVPIAGYVLTQGQCSSCGHAIDRFHLIGEGGGAIIAAGSVWLDPSLGGGLLALTGMVLLSLSLIDIKTLRLPDAGTAIVAGLCAIMAFRQDSLIEGIVAAVVSAAILYGLKRLLERRRSQTLLGLGDIKLIAALALGLGQWTAATVALASLLGLLTIVVLRKPAQVRLPFGPFIAVSGFVALLMIYAVGGLL